MRRETLSPHNTHSAGTETAPISPVSFQGFLSNWKYGIQAAHTHTYHASTSNSRSASPYSNQGQDAGSSSSQQHTDESSCTEMDSGRGSEVQMVSHGASLPALHSADCDSDSQRQHTLVNLLLYCCCVA